MFLQAPDLGWKEVEWMIHWGHQHGLPHLDPQADVSAIQSVGYQSTSEEIWDLYHQVYKLRRFLGSPLCWPEQVCKLTRDVVSSLKNHLQWRGGEQPSGCKEPEPADTHPSWDRAPQRMRQDVLARRELAEAREAHWWVLATTTALEERIERLSWSTTRSMAGPHIPSQSHDRHRRRSWGQSKRHHRASSEDSPTPSPTYSPPWWGPEAPGDQEAESSHLEFDLGPPSELGPDVESFFQEQASGQGEDTGSGPSQEPLMEDYERWVEWRGQMIMTSTWWWELLEILEVCNVQKLAWKIKACFKLPKWMSKIHDIKNYYLSPPSP